MLISGLPAFSQNTENTREQFNNEIGINVSQFIKNYINFSEYYHYHNPVYFINYKRVDDKQAFRISLGGFYTVDKDTGGYNSNTNFSGKTYSINTLIGYEFRHTINKRWMYYYGLHFLHSYNEYASENLEPANGRPYRQGTIKEYGAGPVFGIQLFLNKRLSISTETNLYFNFSRQEEKTSYPNDPDYDKEELHEHTTLQFSPPLTITLSLLL